MPYQQRLEHLGLWSLEERRNRADVLEVFKIKMDKGYYYYYYYYYYY